MRMLLLSNVFPPGFIGGYELAALDLAIELQVRGNEVHVLTSAYFLDDHDELSTLNVFRSLVCATLSHEMAPADPINNLYYNYNNLRALGSAIRRIKPDVVLSFNLHGLGVLSLIQYLQNIRMPHVLYLMDNVFSGLDITSALHREYEKLFGPFELTDTTRIVSVSNNTADEVGATLGTELREVTYIPGLVDVDRLQTNQILPRKGGRTRFVFLSRVAEHKGIGIVLDAVERLVKAGMTRFAVDVYGAGQLASLQHSVKAKGLDGHVAYKGLLCRGEILENLSCYDALLFPTWEREPFGLVAAEASVAGCFPIITAGIGASEWLLDGYDCLKISRDSAALSNAMSLLMLLPDEEIVRMRSVARRSGRKCFAFKRWYPAIQRLCLEASKMRSENDVLGATKGVESALLFLSSLFRETLASGGIVH